MCQYICPKQNEGKRYFFRDLTNVLVSLNISINDKIIIAGDWNSIQNMTLDKKGGNKNQIETVTEGMKELINTFELVDIWRTVNPNLQRFTYRQKTPIIQSRLDYFMISPELEDMIYKSHKLTPFEKS